MIAILNGHLTLLKVTDNVLYGLVRCPTAGTYKPFAKRTDQVTWSHRF
jgi:hypothetical protein